MDKRHTIAFVAATSLVIVGLGVFVYAIFTVTNKPKTPVATPPETTQPIISTPPATQKPVTLIFGGDVMLSRVVGAKMAALNDWSAPWVNIADTFAAADISFVNLEGAFSDQGPRAATTGFLFKDEPQAIAGLERAGIDAISFANNHVTNAGTHGIEYTVAELPKHGIETAGSGLTFEAAHEGTVIERKGVKIAFLAYTYDQTSNDPSSGITVNGMNVDQLKKDIQAIKPKTDFIVVSMHAGVEYARTATTQQQNFARAAIDAGADLVIGTHPHVIEPIEEYKGKYIFYSLGNLIFDQNWSTPTSQGLVTRVTITSKKIQKIELAPVLIEQNYRPKFVTDPNQIKDILSPITYPQTPIITVGLKQS